MTDQQFQKHRLEDFLAIRGREFLAQQQRQPSTIHPSHATAQGVSHGQVVAEFGPGSGFAAEQKGEVTKGGGGMFGKKR